MSWNWQRESCVKDVTLCRRTCISWASTCWFHYEVILKWHSRLWRQEIFYVIFAMATAEQFNCHTESNFGVAIFSYQADSLTSPLHIYTSYSTVPVTRIMFNSFCNYVLVSACLQLVCMALYHCVCLSSCTWLPVPVHSWDITPGCCLPAWLCLEPVRSAASVV